MLRLFARCIVVLSFVTFVRSLPASGPVSNALSLSSNRTTSLQSQCRCEPRFGRFKDLALNSCANAFNKISRWVQPVIFGIASLAQKDFTVPLRYLSDDGLCAFDVEMKSGANGDVSNGVAISNAAKRAWNECPLGKGMGGKTTDFTVYGNLRVNVMKYDPHVTCFPLGATTPSLDSCRDLFQTMPSGRKFRAFTGGDKGRSGQMILPKTFSNGQCSLVLNIEPPGISTIANFWEVWLAAAAVTEMCVQFGRNGMAGMLGDDYNMELTSRTFQADQPSSALTMNTTLPEVDSLKLFAEG